MCLFTHILVTFVHQCNDSVHSPLKRYTEWVFCSTCSSYAKYIFIYILQVRSFCTSYHLQFVYCICVHLSNTQNVMYYVILSSFAFQRSIARHSPLKRYTEWVFCYTCSSLQIYFHIIYSAALVFLFSLTSRIREGEILSTSSNNNCVPLTYMLYKQPLKYLMCTYVTLSEARLTVSIQNVKFGLFHSIVTLKIRARSLSLMIKSSSCPKVVLFMQIWFQSTIKLVHEISCT